MVLLGNDPGPSGCRSRYRDPRMVVTRMAALVSLPSLTSSLTESLAST
ncbi:Uncharacterised protein [Mycobacteroides abscessus subsp. abscessus]|nr:Uncharacterised protein [Mycobacteroides abscessus subsp. abscessus]